MQLVIGLVLFVILVAQVVFLAIHHRELRRVLADYWPTSGLAAVLVAAAGLTGDDAPAVD